MKTISSARGYCVSGLLGRASLRGVGLVLLGVLAGCEPKASAPAEADLPNVVLDIRRTELPLRALYAAHKDERPSNLRDQAGTIRQLSGMFEKHAGEHYAFFSNFLADTIGAPREEIGANVAAFALTGIWQQLIDSVRVRYPEGYDFDTLLRPGLRRFRAAFPLADFPNTIIPPIRTYVSGYQEPGLQTMDPGFWDDHFIGLGLHYHVGPQFLYPRDLPRYLRRRFDAAYLPVRVIDLGLNRVLPSLDQGLPGGATPATPRLVDHIVLAGIRAVALERLLPQVPDSVRLGYSAAQVAWAEANEAVIYNALVPHLFEEEGLTYRQYVGEAPGTPSVAAEAPPRLATWLGWRAMRSYLAAHPEVSLAELARRTDYQQLFTESRYKPR